MNTSFTDLRNEGIRIAHVWEETYDEESLRHRFLTSTTFVDAPMGFKALYESSAKPSSDRRGGRIYLTRPITSEELTAIEVWFRLIGVESYGFAIDADAWPDAVEFFHVEVEKRRQL